MTADTMTDRTADTTAVIGGWQCHLNSDCSFLSGGPERGWYVHLLLKMPTCSLPLGLAPGRVLGQVSARCGGFATAYLLLHVSYWLRSFPSLSLLFHVFGRYSS